MTSWCFKNRFTFLNCKIHFKICILMKNTCIPRREQHNWDPQIQNILRPFVFFFWSVEATAPDAPELSSLLLSLPRLNLSLDAMTFTVFSILYGRCWAWASAVNTRKLSPLQHRVTFPPPAPASPVTAVLIEDAPHFYVFSLSSTVCGGACLLWW